MLKYPSGTIIAFQDFFHQHEFGCWWRTHHHLRQTPWSRRHPFFIQSFFTLNTSLGQITLEDYLKLWEFWSISQLFNPWVSISKVVFLGCTVRHFEWLRTNLRSIFIRLKFGRSGPKIFKWSGKMGRREPLVGDCVWWNCNKYDTLNCKSRKEFQDGLSVHIFEEYVLIVLCQNLLWSFIEHLIFVKDIQRISDTKLLAGHVSWFSIWFSWDLRIVDWFSDSVTFTV